VIFKISIVMLPDRMATLAGRSVSTSRFQQRRPVTPGDASLITTPRGVLLHCCADDCRSRPAVAGKCELGDTQLACALGQDTNISVCRDLEKSG
jgi:hypothetical protein